MKTGPTTDFHAVGKNNDNKPAKQTNKQIAVVVSNMYLLQKMYGNFQSLKTQNVFPSYRYV